MNKNPVKGAFEETTVKENLSDQASDAVERSLLFIKAISR